jgi:CheY-like chemotaxis protein/signal transduction histidine kinase
LANSGDDHKALKARIRELEQQLARHTRGAPQSAPQTQGEPGQQERRLSDALAAAHIGLWDWHIPSGRCYVSRGYWQLLGYRHPPDTTNWHTLQQQLHPADRDHLLNTLHSAIAEHRPSLQLEHRLHNAQGETRWVNNHCVLLEPDAHGTATRCVGVISDITHSVNSHAELINAKAEAEQASTTKSRFLASMSHEIRTPMNAIIGLGHLLQDTPLDATQHSYLHSMEVAAETLLQTVNQVFDYAKLDAGNIALEHSHFDLERVFERLAHQFESRGLDQTTGVKAVDINFAISDDVPLFMRGDATRLNHVISHLVSNALQYAYSPEILVEAKLLQQQSDTITLGFTITDYGRGMSPDTLQHLRDDLQSPSHRFFNQKGGFGLQICKLLVELMHGTIELDSQPGKATTFSFSAQFEKSHMGARRLQDSEYHCRALRLLVVDDNQLALDILRQSASKLIDQVDTACDAHVACEKIRRAEHDKRPYDLVLIDYKMPIKNGLSAAQDIKTACDLNRKPRIFLVSSLSRDEIFSQPHNHLKHSDIIDDFLSKPVSESRLFDAICKALPECLQSNLPSDSDDFNSLNGWHVLLVEDNIVNQQVAVGMLHKKGVQVSVANHGQEALEQLASGTHFDAVLMDIEMPVMDGIATTEQIRRHEHHHSLPIIALTAQAMQADRERCLAAGMNDYISKPIKPNRLYKTLINALTAPL